MRQLPVEIRDKRGDRKVEKEERTMDRAFYNGSTEIKWKLPG